jgi:hypothetical protein
MAKESLEQRVMGLEGTVKGFKHEVERLQAVNEIQNLMSKYEYLHMTNRNKEVMELYAQNAPDVSISIKEMGTWEGHDAPNRAWSVLDQLTEENPIENPVAMGIHPTTTPVIVVAGDGKTAKGVWLGTGFVAEVDTKTRKPKCMWEWDRYGVDFVKEDGKWKFWHFNIYSLFSAGWDDNWADQFTKERAAIIVPDELKPDAPPVDSNPYQPGVALKLIPLPPEPYETWDDKMAY